MASPYREPFSGSKPPRHSGDYSSEISLNGTVTSEATTTPYKLPEPVTPPASIQSNSSQIKSHYFSQPQFPQKTQFSTPTVNMRDHRKTSFSYGAPILASPSDTPGSGGSYAYSIGGNQQKLLATPHTPFSNSIKSSVPATPIGGPIIWPGINPGSANSNVVPTTTPRFGHSRSYSYTPVDIQTNLNRLSISSTSSSGSMESARPRAYSLSMPGVNSSNQSSVNQPLASQYVSPASSALEISSTNPFPPPLSSPLSPEHLNPSNSVINVHRGSYPYTFLPSISDDVKSVHSSLTSGPLRQLDDASNGRRSSPPQPRYHSRRSSSNASSIDFSTQPGNAGVASASTLGSIDQTPPKAVHQTPASPSQSSTSPTAPSSASVNNLDILALSPEQICSLCRDQRGCRFLQRKLSERNPAIFRTVFDATKNDIVSFMMDPFGNYFCQKMFESCAPDDITALLTMSAPSLPSVAINQHGTRALQKLIDMVTVSEQVEVLINALNGHVVRLIRDLNGNHVIQKLLLSFDKRGSQFIYDSVCNSIVDIGSHRHGCCVLQRCLDYADERNQQNLIAHIIVDASSLVYDPFGNYVCQYVIDLDIQSYTDSMVKQFLGMIGSLSVQKFSSNVVEKCLRASSPPLQRALLAEIMVPKTFHELLLDNYGNYVIQTALESTGSLDSETKKELAASVQTALMVTKSPYGRRIMAKLKAW